MGRPQKTSQIHASAIYQEPQALEREIVHDTQTRFDEATIKWGVDDALPLRILQAVSASPTTISCLGKVADYMQGEGFSDKGLMQMAIDKDGTTLGDLHNDLCDYMAKLEGFAVRFTYDMAGDITNCYLFQVESTRFVKPAHSQSRKISEIKYNPYWGTSEFKPDDTQCYNVWEKDRALRYREIKNADPKTYKGQILFHGKPRAPYKFYPVAKYWSGSNAIYTDAAIDVFVKKGLDNGFFQSLLINMIGDPTQPSKNPKYYKRETGSDGVVRSVWDGTTIGQEFEQMMAATFSGSDKAFKAMVMWALNKDASAKIEAFPQNQTFSFIDPLEIRTIRKITIATEVPAILANLPQQVSSLGSDGESMTKAVELIQARVREPQLTLEAFYNNILLPNLQEKTSARVKIKQLTPFSNSITVPDKIWEWMNDAERAEFVKMNVPTVTVNRPAVQPTATPDTSSPDQTQAADIKPKGALSQLKMSDVNRVTGIVNKVAKGQLTRTQGVQILLDYGFNEDQIKDWLPDEEAVTA